MTDLSTSEITIFCLAGLYIVKEFAAPLVKTSFSRNVQAADERAKKVDTRLDDHDKKLTSLEIDKVSSSNLSSELGKISGQLEALDGRIAKQGDYHDRKLVEALSGLSTEFNHKLATTLNVELERTVRQVVREELQGRRK